MDIALQWAKYTDASDQCSLSRIWGGIHPPVDDVPGRLIGEKIGRKAFQHARKYFENEVLAVDERIATDKTVVYPNPVESGRSLRFKTPVEAPDLTIQIRSTQGAILYEKLTATYDNEAHLNLPPLPAGAYLVSLQSSAFSYTSGLLVE